MNYPRGTEVIINNLKRAVYVGRKGKITAGPDNSGDYIVEFGTPGSLGYDYDFFREWEFVVTQANYYYPPISNDFFKNINSIPTSKSCNHRWKGILLLTSTVFDCELCGAKKEEIEVANKVDDYDFGVPF